MVKLYLSASFDSAGADGPLPDPKAIIPKVFATIAKNNRLLRTPSPFLAALETLGYGPETDPDWLDKVLQEIENLAMRRASNSADWM